MSSIFEEFLGHPARFVTACPTGGATQHFFLALCRGPKILESPKKENNSRQQLVQVFFGKWRNVCVVVRVPAHLRVLEERGMTSIIQLFLVKNGSVAHS